MAEHSDEAQEQAAREAAVDEAIANLAARRRRVAETNEAVASDAPEASDPSDVDIILKGTRGDIEAIIQVKQYAALVNQRLDDINHVLERMQRDQEEIQQLKAETRSILARLQVA